MAASHVLLESTASVDTRSPIAATLARAAARIPYFTARAGAPPDGWRLASDVVADPAAVSRLLDEVLAAYETDDRQAGAAFLVLGYFWSPMLAAVTSFVLERRVPDLSASAVAFDLHRGTCFTADRFLALPEDPAAGQPGVTVVPDADALRDYIVQTLDSEHATPLFATLRSVAPFGINGMRANYVDRFVSAVVWLANAVGDRSIALVEVPEFVRRMSDRSRAGVIEIEHCGHHGLLRLQGGCCLNYRMSGREKCETCCLRPCAERLAIARQALADAAAD